MRNINSIVDFEKHPINDILYIQKCNSLIKIDPMEGISSIGSILINTN